MSAAPSYVHQVALTAYVETAVVVGEQGDDAVRPFPVRVVAAVVAR